MSVLKIATRRPTAVHTSPASCKLRSRVCGLGFLVGTGPVFGRCSGSRPENPGALGLSQVHIGERETAAPRGHPTTPPSGASLLPRAPPPAPPQLPDAPLGLLGGWARAPRARLACPLRPLTRPPAAPHFFPMVSPLRSSASKSRRRGREGTGSCSSPDSRVLGLWRRAPSAAARARLSHGGGILTEPTAVLVP